MTDQRNLIIAVILSVIILLSYELFFAKEAPPPAPQSQSQIQDGMPTTPNTAAPSAPGTSSLPAPGNAPTAQNTAPRPDGLAQVPDQAGNAGRAGGNRAAIIASTPRVSIETPRLTGSIDLKGGRLDDLLLTDYRTTIDPESPPIVLLTPQGMSDAYYAQFGWVASAGVEVPGPETIWQADRSTLTPGNPVTLTWTNPDGLVFAQIIEVDNNFMFTIHKRITNATSNSVTVYPYGYVSRRGTPPTTGYVVLHEGLLGVIDGTLHEISYDDIQDDGKAEQTTTGGWLGFTDKYWLAALAPDQTKPVAVRFTHRLDNTVDKYQADYLEGAMTVAPGNAGESTARFFAGAKEVALLDGYADNLGIARFDLAIDFGWFYFLTKPIFYALVYIHKVVANFGFAIILLTIAIKICFFPLANKSYVAMSKMRKLQPEMMKLRERYGEDKMKLNQETMELYKRSKVNPASGCLPVIIQIPVFFALYKVLFVTIEMRHAPFFGWIKDLSVPDPTSLFNLFGLIPFTPPDFLMIGVWPLIMGFTMWLQMKINPQPVDPMQAKIFTFLPIIFTFMLAQFPAGLVIYWACNNILSIAQQWVIMKRMGAV